MTTLKISSMPGLAEASISLWPNSCLGMESCPHKETLLSWLKGKLLNHAFLSHDHQSYCELWTSWGECATDSEAFEIYCCCNSSLSMDGITWLFNIYSFRSELLYQTVSVSQWIPWAQTGNSPQQTQSWFNCWK